MNCFTVDLYEYFKVQKPHGARANLCCYVKDNSEEINLNRKNPAMLIIPGGGYGMVSDREGEPIALNFLSRGFCCFVLTYSVAPIRYPYQLVEAVMAMAYIRKNAKELLIDENMVASIGFSAGGHLCGMLGSISDCDDVKAIFSADVPVAPNAIILSYAVIKDKDKAHQGSFDNLCGDDDGLKGKLNVAKLVNKNSAPAFIWTTRADAVVPVKNSLVIAEAYENVGVPFAIHVWGKGEHGLSVADKTVYGGHAWRVLDEKTKSVNLWLDLAEEWLAEMGIAIQE